ncbi:hypothetical protein [Phenylobacterium koreense]|uniref:TonB C-terminal domain-containing protein n=1 Tax=Phenylobacterium koreense TaxID=266125 RepID=A0ABV2ENH2_9CAUL
MLPTALAAAAAMIASSYAPAARPTQTEQAVIAQVMVDCEIAGATLTDCKAVDAQGPQAAEAVRLAQQIEVSEAFALANPGRILVRMNVTP